METFKYASYGEPECMTLSCSDLSAYGGDIYNVPEEDKRKLFITPQNCGGSDYGSDTGTSGLACKSNYEVFIRDFYDKEIEGVYKIVGGYNSYGIAIRLDVYENNKEVREYVDCLECEVVLDDQHYYALESEWKDEAVSRAYDSIYSEIFMDDDFDDDTTIEDREKVEQWIREAIEYLNVDLEYGYVDCSFSTDQVIPYIKDMLILNRNDYPLYTNREWCCDHIKEIFMEKLANGIVTLK